MFRLPNSQKKNSKDPLGVIDGSWNNERLTFCVCTCVFKFLYITEGTSYIIYYTHSEITGGPCNLISSNWCDLFTNRTIFCFKSHLFPSQWAGHTKTKQPIRFQGLFNVANQIAGKWKTKSIMWQILQLLFSKLLFFALKNGWI